MNSLVHFWHGQSTGLTCTVDNGRWSFEALSLVVGLLAAMLDRMSLRWESSPSTCLACHVNKAPTSSPIWVVFCRHSSQRYDDGLSRVLDSCEQTRWCADNAVSLVAWWPLLVSDFQSWHQWKKLRSGQILGTRQKSVCNLYFLHFCGHRWLVVWNVVFTGIQWSLLLQCLFCFVITASSLRLLCHTLQLIQKCVGGLGDRGQGGEGGAQGDSCLETAVKLLQNSVSCFWENVNFVAILFQTSSPKDVRP